MTQTMLLRIGHSPDPDDAFMFYALAQEVEGTGLQVEHVLEDIESLNKRAETAELEVTAVSAASYPQIADKYFVMKTGASLGRGYGPILVAKEPMDPNSIGGKKVAIPGEQTTANLLLQIYSPEVERVVVDFDRIPDAVADGSADIGLIIHEGQITYGEWGLHKILDYGEVWEKDTGGLPLPLGLDLVRRDLGRDLAVQISDTLRRSIAAALANEHDALEYARQYGRGISPEVNEKFVKMYVNEDTLDMGEPGLKALNHLYTRAQEKGLLDKIPQIDLV